MSDRNRELFAKRTEVRMMIRVALTVGCPAPLERRQFTGETRAIALASVAPAGLGLVVHEYRARLIE